jgi:hypothetical protein
MVLAGDVFDLPIRKDIIHRVVLWQRAKRQQVLLALCFRTIGLGHVIQRKCYKSQSILIHNPYRPNKFGYTQVLNGGNKYSIIFLFYHFELHRRLFERMEWSSGLGLWTKI